MNQHDIENLRKIKLIPFLKRIEMESGADG